MFRYCGYLATVIKELRNGELPRSKAILDVIEDLACEQSSVSGIGLMGGDEGAVDAGVIFRGGRCRQRCVVRGLVPPPLAVLLEQHFEGSRTNSVSRIGLRVRYAIRGWCQQEAQGGVLDNIGYPIRMGGDDLRCLLCHEGKGDRCARRGSTQPTDLDRRNRGAAVVRHHCGCPRDVAPCGGLFP